MTTSRKSDTLSRRTALAGIGAGGLGIALASATRHATAQDTSPVMANHPIVGTWLVGRAPNDLSVTHWGSDGNMTASGPIAAVGQDGSVAFSNIPMGVWEPDGERGIHFTFTFANFDATGKLVNTWTVSGYPVVGEDGASFWDDGKKVTVTIRDTTGVVVQVIGEDGSVPGIGGVRMAASNAGYDEMLARLAAQQSATPTS